VALVGLACGEAARPPPVPAEPPAFDPVELPPASPQQEAAPLCLGDLIVAPTPPDPAPLPCTETLRGPDGRERGRVLRKYDAAGRLLSLEEFGADGALQRFERITYDAAGRVTSRETPELRERTTYDACGRTLQQQQVTSLGIQQLTLHGYDAEGRLRVRETRWGSDRTVREAWTYDAEGRLVEESLEHSDLSSLDSTTHHHYDAGGLRVRSEARHGSGSETVVEYTYDAQGHLLRAEGLPDAAGYASLETWTYDAAGRPTRHWVGMQAQGSPLVPDVRTEWSYPAEGGSRVTVVEGDDTTGHTYDAQGREVGWSTANVLHAVFTSGARTYGARGELVREESRWGSSGHFRETVEERHYDEVGRLAHLERTERTDLEPSGPLNAEQRFRYDAEGRLQATESWSLDTEPALLTARSEYAAACHAPAP
jgi:YD repeat-containing protein